MCGIVGIASQKKGQINQEVLTDLKTLEYRGYDSWGVAVLEKGRLKVTKEVGKIGQTVLSPSSQAQIGIGHTRWATHGGVTRANAHPHLSYDGRFALVHNGIVENFLELKAKLLKQRPTLKFRSQTDSEVIVHLLASLAEKMPINQAFFQTLKSLAGLNAVVVLDKETHRLLAFRHGSPLVFGQTAADYYFASDAIALLPHTQQVYYLHDREVMIGQELFDLDSGKKRQVQLEKLPLAVEQLTLGGFKSFMEKEIHEAPAVIDRLVAEFQQQAVPLLKIMNQYQDYALIGCGSAYYAALAGQYLLAKSGKLAIAYSGGEVGHFLTNWPETTLPIFLSQSGETIDLIEQVNRLKKNQRPIVALVNRLGSTLDREATISFHLQAGPEISVVSTKAFLAKLTAWILITASLTGQLSQAQAHLLLAQAEMKKFFSLSGRKKLTKVAKKLAKEPEVFVLGRGQSYPIALEAALKAKEAAYCHFEGFAGGELKHGVIALIEPGTWVIVLLSGDDQDQNMLSNAQEIKARGGKILGVSPTPQSVFDEWLEFGESGQANLLLQTVLVQLIGLHLALVRGLDPDKPRNLAKSVTVK